MLKVAVLEHNVRMYTGFMWHGTGSSGGIFHKDMINIDSKDRSSVRKFHLTSCSAVNAAVSLCLGSGSTHLLPSVAVNIRYLLAMWEAEAADLFLLPVDSPHIQ
jgi:hypothetical protein